MPHIDCTGEGCPACALYETLTPYALQAGDGPVYNWGRIARLSRGGNRIAQCKNTNRWAIFDNSGRRPEETEDGVTWIDQSRPVEVSLMGDLPMVVVPALDSSGDNRRAHEPLIALMVLLLNIPDLTVKVSPRALDIHDLLTLARNKQEGK